MMRWGLSSSSRRVEARCRGGEFSRRPVTILGRTANALYSFRNQGNGEGPYWPLRNKKGNVGQHHVEVIANGRRILDTSERAEHPGSTSILAVSAPSRAAEVVHSHSTI